MNRLVSSLAILLGVHAISPVPHAQAAVHRCVGADGQTIFTDRSCAALGATPAGPRGAASAGGPTTMMGVEGAIGGFAIRGCARTPEALQRGVRDALQARDVNRLANFYHWSGTGTSGATALMNRLERIAEGPSGAVQLVYATDGAVPAPAPVPPPQDEPSRTEPRWWPTAAVAVVPESAAPPGPPAPPPVGLRVEIARADRAGGFEAAFFSLRQNAGCWWIQF